MLSIRKALKISGIVFLVFMGISIISGYFALKDRKEIACNNGMAFVSIRDELIGRKGDVFFSCKRVPSGYACLIDQQNKVYLLLREEEGGNSYKGEYLGVDIDREECFRVKLFYSDVLGLCLDKLETPVVCKRRI